MAGSTVTADDLAAAADGPLKPDELPESGSTDFFVTTGAVRKDHLRGVSSLSAQANGERPTIGAVRRMISIAFAAVTDGLAGRVADWTGRVLQSYPDAPMIYVAELADWKGTPRLSLDLRRDRPRVAVSGFDARQLFIAEVLRGVIAGAVEREVIGFAATDNSPSKAQRAPAISTNLVFERAQAARIESVLLSGTTAQRFRRMCLPTHTPESTNHWPPASSSSRQSIPRNWMVSAVRLVEHSIRPPVRPPP